MRREDEGRSLDGRKKLKGGESKGLQRGEFFGNIKKGRKTRKERKGVFGHF